MKPRKIPLRKCTGCNEMKNKKDMIRIVRDQEGNFSLDFHGKKIVVENGELAKLYLNREIKKDEILSFNPDNIEYQII